jgi:hypothetical protein
MIDFEIHEISEFLRQAIPQRMVAALKNTTGGEPWKNTTVGLAAARASSDRLRARFCYDARKRAI